VRVRYYIDVGTQMPHIHSHGVVEAEAEYVLRHAGEDRPARDGARAAIGQTAGGRHLRVIYVPDSVPNSVFVVTAYELVGKPLAAYRRRRRRQHR